MSRLSESSVINIKNKSHSVTAEIEVPHAGAHGVVIAQGGAFGGWVLYANQGELKYCHNFIGLQRFTIGSEGSIPAGKHQVRMEFTYAGGGLAKGGDVRLYVDGAQVGDGQLPATVPLVFSGDETTDLGKDTGSSVSDDYTSEESLFSGIVNWVQLDIDDAAEDLDHLISPEERLRIAMAKQ